MTFNKPLIRPPESDPTIRFMLLGVRAQQLADVEVQDAPVRRNNDSNVARAVDEVGSSAAAAGGAATGRCEYEVGVVGSSEAFFGCGGWKG